MANIPWIGKAGGTAHTYTVTIANTWAGADTVSVTINQSTVTVTVATGENTTNEVAAAIGAAINAQNATANLAGTETRNVGGQQYPEFRLVTATVLSSVVTVRANNLGIPFTLSSAESTAGTGTATAANSVNCTGPHHADNATNWSGGSLPADGDVMVFNQGSVDCSYGLTYFRTNTLKHSLLRTSDYTGTIGLSLLNAAGFLEYRQRWLQLYDTADAKTITFEEGTENKTGGDTYLDLQGSTYAALTAKDLGASGRLYAHGGTVSAAYLGDGEYFIDPDDSNASAGMTLDVLELGNSGRVALGRLTTVSALTVPVRVQTLT